jgi:hypothetical protein
LAGKILLGKVVPPHRKEHQKKFRWILESNQIQILKMPLTPLVRQKGQMVMIYLEESKGAVKSQPQGELSSPPKSHQEGLGKEHSVVCYVWRRNFAHKILLEEVKDDDGVRNKFDD